MVLEKTFLMKMDDDLKNGRRPQKWKMTSKMEDDLKNGRLPPSRFHPYITRGYVEPFIARGHVEPFITCDSSILPSNMTVVTLVPHGTKKGQMSWPGRPFLQ